MLALGGLAVLAARLIWGLGAVTNLNDQYPWGIWIGIDVATGVALAAGGFTTAFIAHVLHHERYHVLVRPALLTAALGYTFVGLGVCVDLGRYYNIWHVMCPSMWQGNSALFEVGMCVCLYLTVLYIEFLPIVCERFIGRVNLPGVAGRPQRLRRGAAARSWTGTLNRVMTVFIIAGVVLSCAHQSSLGTLMVIAPTKLHPLWHTTVLPLQFLLSAFAVGLSMAIFESILASRSFKRPYRDARAGAPGPHDPLPADHLLRRPRSSTWSTAAPGATWSTARCSRSAVWSRWCVGVILPWRILSQPPPAPPARLAVQRRGHGRLRRGPQPLQRVRHRLQAAVRRPRPTCPAWTEVLLTVGFISILVLLYRAAVFVFPVLHDEEEVHHA